MRIDHGPRHLDPSAPFLAPLPRALKKPPLRELLLGGEPRLPELPRRHGDLLPPASSGLWIFEPTVAVTGAVIGATLLTGASAATAAQPAAAPIRVDEEEIATAVLFDDAVPASASSALAEARANGVVLKRGDQGQAVRELQRRLDAIGFDVKETGTFDASTERVLKSFQHALGVARTGQFGPLTYNALVHAEGAPFLAHRTSGEAYRAGKSIGRIELVKIDGKPIEIRAAHAYRRLVEEAAKDGVQLRLVSGFRTNSEQAHLYRLFRSGRGNPAFRPGYSIHQIGTALDLNARSAGVNSWLRSHAPGHGFTRPYAHEPWHWEYHPPTS